MKKITVMTDLYLIRAGTYVMQSDKENRAFILEIVHRDASVESGASPEFRYLHTQYHINNCDGQIKTYVKSEGPYSLSSTLADFDGYVSNDIYDLIELIPVDLVILNSELIRQAIERTAWRHSG